MTAQSPFEHVFRRVFVEQFASLFRYLDRLSGDPALAADLAQEAFVRLYQRGALPDHVAGWLAAVAANLFRDERRRTERQTRLLAEQPPELTLGAPAPPPDTALLAEERRAAVRTALDTLSSRDRHMLLLRHEGYSYREVAEALGIPTTSVGTLLVRATAAFRAAYLAMHRASD